MDSLGGHVLIATPELVDPNFRRTVVLVVQHDEDGALGLVLNRPSNTALARAWQQVRESPCRREQVLYLGGPCQGPLMALHGDRELADIEVLSDLYFCGEPEKLERLVEQDAIDARFFCGYSGWGPGQLDGELEAGGWLVLPASRELAFHFEEDIWRQTLRQATGQELFRQLGVREVPGDLSNN